MNWHPISEADLLEILNRACNRMSTEQSRLWEIMKISPEKWNLDPYGKEGGGFWIVSIIGNFVVWYNDIEEGFNRSTYSNFGEIREYRCNQNSLEITIQEILNEIKDGYDSSRYASIPIPIS